jgi:sulfur-oxidizing protein SoxX
MSRHRIGVAILLAVILAACVPGQRSASGFRLPEGDPHRGEAAFVAQRCHSCHEVAGAHLPPPVANPPVPVVLGGETTRIRTGGELVTAIVYPFRALAVGYPREAVASGRLSRMGNFNDSLSVQELVDVVAFLQAHYVVVNPPPTR